MDNRKLVHWRVRSRILIEEKPVHGFPMRMWQLCVVGAKDSQLLEFEDISYYVKEVHVELHPTFENPVRILKAPFVLVEKGWGEFDMKITLIFNHLGVPSHQFQAFLSFNEAKGQGTQELKFNPSFIPSGFLKILNQTGNSIQIPILPPSKPKKISFKNDNDKMESLARKLRRLAGNEIEEIVTLIRKMCPHSEIATEENSELVTFDLYTMDERDLVTLWTFCSSSSKE